ncbi:hypothetical protein MRY87_00980 [bacterium]|nr:hypothetical protein [bacterium]
MTVGTNPERQSDYQETPYEDASWEIIDEVDENPQFAPLEMEVLNAGEFSVDPMFEDYGGTAPADTVRLFHATDVHQTEPSVSPEELLRREIAELREKHAQELQALEASALERGREEGRAAREAEHEASKQQVDESIQTVIRDMFQQLKETVTELEEHSVQFSLEVAKKIIGSSVEVNPEYIVEIVQEALKQAGTALIKKIRVSPEDFEFIEVLGVRKVIQGFDGSWDFEADATINSGCVVDTSAGEIDYQLDEAWERIAEEVVRVLR